MGRIQASIGLFSGVPILDTVDKLIALSARPRDLIIARNQGLQTEQVAIAQLTSLILAVQLATDPLGKTDVFQTKTVTSQDPALLIASLVPDANPTVGNYSFTPVRRADAHQVLSSTFSSLTDPIGAGSISLQFGGFLDTSLELTELNGGAGAARGEIRITDRSGTAAVIDLRFAQTVEDVLDAINNENTIDITATVEGDLIRLTDTSGGSGGITVDELGGTTAAGLGLSGIDGVDTSASVDGTDIVSLYNGLKLTNIGDGGGVGFRSEVDDLVINLLDTTTLNIDFNAAKQATGTTSATEGVNAQLTFTAVSTGAGSDGVTILFVDNPTVTKGNETVTYDASDTSAKTLTFNIDVGQTDAADIVAALAGDATASAQFTAVAGGTGAGLVDLVDTTVTSGGAPIDPLNVTLSDVLTVLNQANPAKLSAAISADGDHIELTDLTSGGGTFSVASAVGSTVAEDLGLTGTAVGGVITSERLLAGLSTTLLSSLTGGSGLGTLGVIGLTDRSGATDTVDLVSAETIDDVVVLINAATVGITASLNSARSGIVLTDTTGSTASNLIVANNDGTNSADAFGITVNAAQTSIDGGSLNRFTVSRQTLLSSLNGGQGVDIKSFVIVDSSNAEGAAILNTSGAELETVGEVIDAINAISNLGVTARINDNGDGILLTDTAGGAGTLSVREVGSGTTAADLNLLGSATTQLVLGVPTQLIDGTTRATVNISGVDTLSDVITKINATSVAVTASSFFDGATYRLSITSDGTGRANELLIDSTGVNFGFQEVTKARDAQILFGSVENAAASALVTSTTNDFDGLVPGVKLTVAGTSTQPVTVSVSTTSTSLIDKVKAFVSAFNSLRTELDTLTDFNEIDNTTGVLFGSNETLRIETEVTDLVTRSYLGVGKFRSLEVVGITIDDKGQLFLDTTKLQTAFDDDPTDLETLFTDETLGVSARFTALVDQLAGEDSSLLTNRAGTLTRKIDTNNERIELFNVRLDNQRNLLLNQFLQMELAIGKMQSALNALSSFTPLPPLVSAKK